MNSSTIQTYSGHKLDLLNPDPACIDIKDIARGLSMQCRYNGQVKEFYSVAEHSMQVMEQLPKKLKIYGLLHDAAEAYIGDIVSPLKRQISGLYMTEADIMCAVCKRFDLDFYIMQSLEVEYADLSVAKKEAETILSHDPIDDWHKDFPDPKQPVFIFHLMPDIAEDDFLYYFDSLMNSPRLIGYQIFNKKTKALPKDLSPEVVLSEPTLDLWLNRSLNRNSWQIIEIHEDDIDEPVLI